MSYKFNDGDGAVICDVCKIVIDEGLSYNDYIENYGEKGDVCWECKGKKEPCPECKGHGGTYDINPRNGDIVGKICETCREKEDILNDGWRN